MKLSRVTKNSPLRKVRAFFVQTTGIAAMEFALILPIFLTIIFGSAGVFDHYLAHKKAVTASDAMADVAGRLLEMNSTEADRLFTAAEIMMGKYADKTTIKMSVTGLVYDQTANVMRVTWSKKHEGASGRTVGDELPASQYPQVADLEMLVESKIEFAYKSPLYFLSTKKLTFIEEGLRKPRYVTAIADTDAN